MKNAEHTHQTNDQETPHEDPSPVESVELDDTDLDAVAGGVTWHLPNEPATAPWDGVSDS